MINVVATFEIDERETKKVSFDFGHICEKLESKGIYLDDYEEIDLSEDQRVLIGCDGQVELL